jgi:hypothetical protein
VSVRRLALALAVLTVAAGAVALPAARADGDPASDTLLFSPIFVPYSQPIDNSVSQKLQAEVTDARKKGTPLRVALIASPYDLGSVGGLWGQPEQYAAFLGQEIGIGQRDKSLLVVAMPAGFGLYAGPSKNISKDQARLDGISMGKTPDDLANAAITAVSRLSGVSASGGGESPWRERAIIIAAALIGLVLAAGLSLLAAHARAAKRANRPETSRGA